MGLDDYDRDRIHHAVLTAGDVYDWYRTLAAEVTAARLDRAGMVPGREDVIVGWGADPGRGDDPVRIRRVPGVGGRHPRRDGGRPAGLSEAPRTLGTVYARDSATRSPNPHASSTRAMNRSVDP